MGFLDLLPLVPPDEEDFGHERLRFRSSIWLLLPGRLWRKEKQIRGTLQHIWHIVGVYLHFKPVQLPIHCALISIYYWNILVHMLFYALVKFYLPYFIRIHTLKYYIFLISFRFVCQILIVCNCSFINQPNILKRKTIGLEERSVVFDLAKEFFSFTWLMAMALLTDKPQQIVLQ